MKKYRTSKRLFIMIIMLGLWANLMSQIGVGHQSLRETSNGTEYSIVLTSLTEGQQVDVDVFIKYTGSYADVHPSGPLNVEIVEEGDSNVHLHITGVAPHSSTLEIVKITILNIVSVGIIDNLDQ